MKTFVVRLFVPAEPGADSLADELRGLVEEVGGGSRASFASRQELLALLAGAPAEPEDTGRDGPARRR